MRTGLSLLTAALLAPTAYAQGLPDLDEPDTTRRRARDFENEIVREVERGYFLKAGIGSQQFLTIKNNVTGGALLAPVVASSLSLGSDFIDKENSSVAWEVMLHQALHNGPKEDSVEGLQGTAQIQGDVHVFTVGGAIEASFYLSRRFGLGIRGGGGVVLMPLLMFPSVYETDVAAVWGSPAAVHEGPLPMGMGGPTIEYYTKLSHFSLGIDADVIYVVGFDLGIMPNGYLKYTF